ncbi:2-phosphosulfolactate phosphatase [Paenibacillus tyrfis]|uniref:2-phosphosulfolactate phosphatase n=1 Tax=Paenibacillus tyrfis TaxID=1501230 RepID=UPI00209C9B4C|nr:2-phosphosulfolactate phosphatase [Paenibacillus tyrfis]MCP1307006.1 2-phosphosulfolactate phosphatase [Paenibacillus tyrfis]
MSTAGEVLIVDVLSFSSTVVTAVEHGAEIYPYPPPINEKAKAYADELNAQLVRGRAEAEKWGGHSLSPSSFTSAELIGDSSSGRELRERGYVQDVTHCSLVDIFKAVLPLYKDGFIKANELSKFH